VNADDYDLPDTGDRLDAMEALGLLAPYEPEQTLAWCRPDAQFFDLPERQPALVFGTRPGRTGPIHDIRFGFVCERTGRLVVSRAGDFVPERFAFWESPPAFDGEPPFFAEARREGWL
jgi:hypothetical protein